MEGPHAMKLISGADEYKLIQPFLKAILAIWIES